MADNVTANPGTGGPTFATDEIGGVHYARTKLAVGADGVAVDVSAEDPLPVTSAQLATIASAIKAEDSPSASGDSGMLILGVRQDADVATSGNDGDHTAFKFDEAGRLKVAAQPGLAPLVTGAITANAQTVFANISRQSNVTLHMVATGLSGHNVTFEASVDSTNGTDGAWFAIQMVRTNANTIELTSGVLAATPAYAWEGSVNGYNWVRVRATAHTAGTATWKIQPAPYATEPVPAIQTHPVTGSGNFNTVPQAGTNLIGDVGLQVRANATGAASVHHIVAAATTNVAQVKATAGRVLGWSLANTTAAWVYLKLHNVASATAGAAVAATIAIPPNGKSEVAIPQGLAFATAISRSIVTGAADTDATAVTASAVVGDIFFA